MREKAPKNERNENETAEAFEQLETNLENGDREIQEVSTGLTEGSQLRPTH